MKPLQRPDRVDIRLTWYVFLTISLVVLACLSGMLAKVLFPLFNADIGAAP